MRKLILIFTALIFTNSKSSFAQEGFTMYNMNLVPQSSVVNPAIMPNDQIFIGFPALGQIHLLASNPAFSFADLAGKDGKQVDITKLINGLAPNNYLNFKTNIDIIDIGIRTKKMYFMFSATEKLEAQFRYPADFMKFVWFGNGDLLGQNLKFNFGLEASHYRDYGLLVSRIINPSLIVGARVHYLYGMENIHTAKSDISLITSDIDYAITAKSDVELNTSGLSQIDIAKKPYTAYNFNKNNSGYGLDLGGKYKINDEIGVTASILNWGFINWKSDTKTYKSKNPNASFVFDGINLNQVFADSAASVDKTLQDFQDSALSKFSIVESYNSYKSKLQPRFFLGGTYQPLKILSASLMFQGYMQDGKMKMGASVGASGSVLEWVDLSITYSMYKKSFNNLGLGIALWPGGINLFVVTDNIIGAIKYKEAKNVNIRVGFSLLYGKYFLNDDADGDLVPDDEDKCPRQPGKKEMHGCPDKDGDMVGDSEDDCPTEYGTKAMNGCPDRDGDRIIDRYDECPDVAGDIQFKGCPDRDNDGIRDSEDKCPTDAGTAELKGCPDKDGDGVGDADDMCPDKPGTRNNRGCPTDTDGDGVADADDKCPDVAGVKNNDGCPDTDTDGDGINDKDDACPFTAGDIKSKGCPTVGASDTKILDEAQNNLKFKDDGEIRASSYPTLETLAGWMKNNKAILNLKSYTSNEGNETKNLELSKVRAESVKTYLIAKGVNLTRINAESFGSAKPIGDNNTAEGREKNNRVEFTVSFK